MAPRHDEQLESLVARADLDGLIRLIDGVCESREWVHLLSIRDAARAAVLTGRQLWPAATLAEYRAALLAPAEVAARTISVESGRFSIGPLTEVIAQHHSWVELEPHLPDGPDRSFVAHERVMRGETITASMLQPVLDLPFTLEAWEPAYPLAVYEPGTARFDTPTPVEGLVPLSLPTTTTTVEDPDTVDAVRALVEPWTADSNGHVEIVAVEGDHTAAIAALGPQRARARALAPAEAIAWLAWAGASGGAHGRRRGAATGRFNAWWTIAALTGLIDDWPLQPGEIGTLARELEWYWWDAFEPTVGWCLRLAIHDPSEGLAWAVAANDLA